MVGAVIRQSQLDAMLSLFLVNWVLVNVPHLVIATSTDLVINVLVVLSANGAKMMDNVLIILKVIVLIIPLDSIKLLDALATLITIVKIAAKLTIVFGMIPQLDVKQEFLVDLPLATITVPLLEMQAAVNAII